MKNFRLIQKMADLGMSQSELARQMHMTKSAINRRITGRVEWCASEAKQLCAIFGCTFEDLFNE